MTNQERIQRLEHVRSRLVLRGGSAAQRDEDQLQITLIDEVLDDLRRELRGGLYVLKTPIDDGEELEVVLLRLVGELSAEQRSRLVEHVIELADAKGCEAVESLLEGRRARAYVRRVFGGSSS